MVDVKNKGGRPRKGPVVRDKTAQARLTAEELADLDHVVGLFGMTRSEVLGELVRNYLETNRHLLRDPTSSVTVR